VEEPTVEVASHYVLAPLRVSICVDPDVGAGAATASVRTAASVGSVLDSKA